MAHCLYLRKSRADIEAEAHGEGETLARHEKLLLEVAKRGHYNITQIYREIVSGETIAARPVVQKLLQEVEDGKWEGVLVVEVERLARGDTIDQGVMAQAFKYSGTKIITPLKVYDPANEFDEEYFEFGLFMSRREYKTINRRLVRGRNASAKEGKWVSGLRLTGMSVSALRVIKAGRSALSKNRLTSSALFSNSIPLARRTKTAKSVGSEHTLSRSGSTVLVWLRPPLLNTGMTGLCSAFYKIPHTSAKSAGV